MVKALNGKFVVWLALFEQPNKFAVTLALTPSLSPKEREEQASGLSYSMIKMPVAAAGFFVEGFCGILRPPKAVAHKSRNVEARD